MGVNGLWDLLSPSARRTKIDQLQSKKIAIDTSIWLVQFSKAMRDDSGNLVEGAHLVGFFRRICKLLFYGIRPVFVFDGKPPALKKKTLMQRKQLQEQQMLGFKRTAEKLLLNKLKLKTLDFVQAKKRSKLERKNLTVPLDLGVSSKGMEKKKMKNQQREIQNTKNDVQLNVNDNISPNFDNLFGSDLFQSEQNLLDLIRKENRRSMYYNSIPKELSYALSGRKTLDDLNVDTSGFENLLNMPTDFFKNSKNYEFLINQELTTNSLKDVKEYPIKQEDGIESIVQLPLVSSVDPTRFSHLDPTVQYSILNDIRDTWFSQTRLLCIQAKDNPEVFSSLQLESFLRHVNTTKEINKVKKKIADKLHLSFLSSNQTTEANISVPSHNNGTPHKVDVTQQSSPVNLTCTSSNQSNFQRSILELRENESVPHIVTESEIFNEDYNKKRKSQKSRCFSEILEKQLNTKVVMPLPRLNHLTENIENGLLYESTWSPSLQLLKPAIPQETNLKVTYKMDENKDQVLQVDEDEEDKIWISENVLDDIFSNSSHQTLTYPKRIGNLHTTQTRKSNDVFVSNPEDGSETCKGAALSGMRKKIHLMKKLKDASLQEQSDQKYTSLFNTESDLRSQSVEADWDSWETLETPSVNITSESFKDTVKKLPGNDEYKLEVQQNKALNSKNILESDEMNKHKNSDRSCSNTPTPSVGDRFMFSKKSCHASNSDKPGFVTLNHSGSNTSFIDSFNAESAKGTKCSTVEYHHTMGEPLPQMEALFNFSNTNSKSIYKVEDTSLLDIKSIELKKNEVEDPSSIDITSDLKKDSVAFTNRADCLLINNKPKAINQNILEPCAGHQCEGLAKEDTAFLLNEDRLQPLNEENRRLNYETEIHFETKSKLELEKESTVVSLTPAIIQSAIKGKVDSERKEKKQMHRRLDFQYTKEELVPVRDEVDNFRKNDWKRGGLNYQCENVNEEKDVITPDRQAVMQNITEPSITSDFEKIVNCNVIIEEDELSALQQRADHPIQENEKKSFILAGKSLDDQTAELEIEQIQLNNMFMDYKKGTEEVTSEMLDDIKELLSLFGIPFVLAPSEAEAQCSTLVELGLCDSVITEDSDCLLFGSRVVYRHFFDPHGAIECYDMNLIESELNLTRKDTILLAMLLGCDYTVGVSGIGIVNALETIRVFPDIESLKEFREWATDLISSKSKNNGILPTDSAEKRLYKEKHKNYRLQWIFPDVFPSMEVWTSFTSPVVDQSKEDFSWSSIYSEGLIKFLTRKTFLTKEQILQTIQPVLQQRLKVQKNSWRQTNIKDFFSTVKQLDRVAKVRSKRVLKLFPSLSNDLHFKESEEETILNLEKSPIKFTTKPRNKKQSSRKTARVKMSS